MTTRKLIGLWTLARDLRIPPAWLKAEATEGRIPCLKIGRKLRFDSLAVEAALLERAQNPTKNENQAARCGD